MPDCLNYAVAFAELLPAEPRSRLHNERIDPGGTRGHAAWNR